MMIIKTYMRIKNAVQLRLNVSCVRDKTGNLKKIANNDTRTQRPEIQLLTLQLETAVVVTVKNGIFLSKALFSPKTRSNCPQVILSSFSSKVIYLRDFSIVLMK